MYMYYGDFGCADNHDLYFTAGSAVCSCCVTLKVYICVIMYIIQNVCFFAYDP